MDCRLYLRASTKEQNASRAKADLLEFAKDKGLKVVGTYMENESGSRLDRPELFRLLDDCHPGDILLCEQVDRLSRLNTADWNKLKAEIGAKQVKVVALDLPTSHQLASAPDDFTGRMMDAINGMMLDMLSAIARKDYDDRRRRQAQGIATALADGRYRGRKADTERNAVIADMLKKGMSYSQIQKGTNASRTTIAKIARENATRLEK
ncbi:recombinase family protein [Agrobacterium tumefaciens]|uniref:recombinase family protein n=1 Tax=Agrobacterium tumefaciens TaxID=358 RepID=UPI001572E858|nr:recombinase family protein [Agrobacterium tumefaciens]NTA82600.1 recombinase family protein [Agrobacterium tumefaciens]